MMNNTTRPLGEILNEKYDALMEKGRAFIYRQIFSLESKLLHGEFSEIHSLLDGMTTLGGLYPMVNDVPPLEIMDALKAIDAKMTDEMGEKLRYKRLLNEKGEVSYQKIRMIRLGDSDLEVLQDLQKCLKEGKQYEARSKIKHLDPRFDRFRS